MAGLAANVVTVAISISSGLILLALRKAMALKFIHRTTASIKEDE